MNANIIEVLIYLGAACVSPLESAPNATVVGKVECAKIIRYSSANPYKWAQEPNVIHEGEPYRPKVTKAKAVPKYKYPPKKKKKPRKGRR